VNDLIERLEAMGRTGGVIALSAGVAVLLAAVALLVVSLISGEGEQGRWTMGGVRFAAFLLVAVALPVLFVGARLLTQTHYPHASEVFPSLSIEELVRTLAEREGDVCVCSRCRLVVPAEFSTGSCPVCASSVEYHEVHTDEDAKMVIATIS